MIKELEDNFIPMQPIWECLRSQRIFMTGCTGFVGRCLLDVLLWANQTFDLKLQLVVLTRNSHQFLQQCPSLQSQACLKLWEGDVRTFSYPPGDFSYVIHAAASTQANNYQNQAHEMLNIILNGTQHTLNFAKQAGTQHFLYVSSGAVYGAPQPGKQYIEEDDQIIMPDLTAPHSAYRIGKHTAEHLCAISEAPCKIKIARLFAFIGPHFPLNEHFAIGNFIRDVLNGQDIQLHSDGSSVRSYQYSSDLVVWLLHILCFGEHNRPYNVGSDQAISILDLAALIAKKFQRKAIIKTTKKMPITGYSNYYVPSIQRAQTDLGLSNSIDLNTAIDKTIAWHQRVIS